MKLSLTHLLPCALFLTISAQGQIQLAWQYDFDASQATNSSHDFSISTIRTNEANYTLAEYRSAEDQTPMEQRFVLLDPAGTQIWLSEDIFATYGNGDSEFIFTEIQQVGQGTVTVGLLHFPDPDEEFDIIETVLRFDQNTNPQVTRIDLDPAEFFALQGVDELDFETDPNFGTSFEPTESITFDVPASRSGSNGFFTTLSTIPNQFDPNSIRRYIFSATPPLNIITQVGVSLGSAILTWEGESGASYQIQTTTDLADSSSWTNVGTVISGNGTTQTWTSELQTASTFFRIIQL